MATALPVGTVLDLSGNASGTVPLPEVFKAPLRADVVRVVFTGMNKNKRQAHGVKYQAGYDTAAISWGTGRAVARIPRVPGGGTHRAGQAAFGNMCRGGGMFNPLKTWRKWHRKINTTAKRHALASAVAATAVAPLVMARGHEISEVAEIPCIVSNDLEAVSKTKDAIKVFEALGASDELQKSDSSKKIRRGKGKMRNRRYVMRKGPLVVYSESSADCAKSFRNIPGVDLCQVERLNLLQLAPGGTFGRFVIWTEGAVKKLNEVFGTYAEGAPLKKGYTLPRPIMVNTDIARIINSTEVQSVLRPAKSAPTFVTKKNRKNPLKNKAMLNKLCPHELAKKKIGKLAHDKNSVVGKKISAKVQKNNAKVKAHKKAKKAFFKNLTAAYDGFEIRGKPVAEESTPADDDEDEDDE